MAGLVAGMPVLGFWQNLYQRPDERPPRVPEAPRCVSVSESLNFPIYWAGPSFEGTDLEMVDRYCHAAPAARLIGSNRVDFYYGDTSDVIPIQVRNYAAAAMPSDSYSPEELALQGAEETVVEGIPARWFGGSKLEIYHPEVTVVLEGRGRSQIEHLVEAIVPAPAVLVEVARYGLVFDEACLERRKGCLADRLQKENWLGWILNGVLLALIGPILAIRFRPPPAPPTSP